MSTDPGGPSPPGRAPTASACEPYRELIAEALGRGRNAMAIWQDLVDDHGFAARYASVRRFVVRLRGAAPTAYDEYAIRAFEVNAIDYLLKPVDKARLRETLNRAHERAERSEIVAEQASRFRIAGDMYAAGTGPAFWIAFPYAGGKRSRFSRSVFAGQDLSKELAMSLGGTLENQPGVAARSFGPQTARPVIRGLSGDRVQILQDRARMGDLSSQSADHAVTVNKECEILECDGPVSTAEQDEGVGGQRRAQQHELSCPAKDHRISGAGDLILANDT